jgi:MoaA/NifB/PqqE/SkfB family radical SAM enzyme
VSIIEHLNAIEINPTELCDLTCSFCPRAYDYPNKNLHMTPETAKIIRSHVDELGFTGRVAIVGRGEPTLAKHFEEITNIFSKNRTYTLETTSNGKWLFDRYSHLFEKYDHVRHDVYDTTYDPNGTSKQKINALRYRKRLEKKFPNVYIQFKPDYGWDHERSYCLSNRTGSIGEKIEPSPKPCSVPQKRLFIDWNGDYNLCCHDWKHKLVFGNVREETIVEYINHNQSLIHYREALMKPDSRRCLTACSECNA